MICVTGGGHMMVKITFRPMGRIMYDRRISGIELAKRSRVARSQISDMLNDKRDPRASTLCALAHGLGCKVDDLMTWSVADDADGR